MALYTFWDYFPFLILLDKDDFYFNSLNIPKSYIFNSPSLLINILSKLRYLWIIIFYFKYQSSNISFKLNFPPFYYLFFFFTVVVVPFNDATFDLSYSGNKIVTDLGLEIDFLDSN